MVFLGNFNVIVNYRKMTNFVDKFLSLNKKVYVILYFVRRKNMKTKEKRISKDFVLLLSFVSVLVFCSFVVSNQITDILYLLVLISYMVYKIKIEKEIEDKESIENR